MEDQIWLRAAVDFRLKGLPKPAPEGHECTCQLQTRKAGAPQKTLGPSGLQLPELFAAGWPKAPATKLIRHSLQVQPSTGESRRIVIRAQKVASRQPEYTEPNPLARRSALVTRIGATQLLAPVCVGGALCQYLPESLMTNSSWLKNYVGAFTARIGRTTE